MANSNGTLIRDPLQDEDVKQCYIEGYGVAEYHMACTDPHTPGYIWGHVKQAIQEAGYQDQLFPNVPEIVNAIRDSGMEFVIYSGAPANKSRKKYDVLKLPIDGTIQAASHLRGTEAGYWGVQEGMRTQDRDPVAYLTHKSPHARAAANVLGKALLSEPHSKRQNVFAFSWEGLTEKEISEIVNFLKPDRA